MFFNTMFESMQARKIKRPRVQRSLYKVSRAFVYKSFTEDGSVK